jgi:hypothetical protein
MQMLDETSEGLVDPKSRDPDEEKVISSEIILGNGLSIRRIEMRGNCLEKLTKVKFAFE